MIAVLNRTYETQICSIARTLEVVGERWTLLVLRDVLRGTRRFDELIQSLGVARNVLSDRLDRLVAHGLVEREPYQDHPPRFEYHPTAKGSELVVVLLGLMHWGDRHLAGLAGPPVLTEHRDCGGAVVEQLACGSCGRMVPPDQLITRPGPGARAPDHAAV
ncbi:MAG TPA: helix-turn-helix domain-containing protein [Actinomycetota bacterium]